LWGRVAADSTVGSRLGEGWAEKGRLKIGGSEKSS
jgi:hypothetical protein